ncbi:MAG: insulinase family protein [Holosporales bacterium]|nr:insulinase family protein [Holosporales bacterium]
MSIKKTELDNGLSVVTDGIESFQTVSLGMFVNVGSVNENEKQGGISHFLEHMAFKGTSKRSALQISHAIESVGGFINAYTSKEVTAFHVKVLKDNVDLAIDIVTDIVQNSTFDEIEFEKERGVIIQEIHQLNDAPDDLVFDMFQEKCFDNERLGTQILGSEEDILSFKPENIREYLDTQYSTNSMVLSASGNLDHDEFCRLVDESTPKMRAFETDVVEKQTYKGGFIFKKKELEQTHLVIGFEGMSHTHENKFDLCAMSTILGGGMSSRLFQEIREKRGWVYSISSFISNYRDTGIFGVYAACEDSKAREVIEVIKDEFEKSKFDIKEEELNKAKIQLKASLLMGLESSSARMERLANQYLLQGRLNSLDQISEKIEAISLASLKCVVEKVFASKPTLAVIGNGGDIEKLYDTL